MLCNSGYGVKGAEFTRPRSASMHKSDACRHDIGTVGGAHSVAYGINASGQVVGDIFQTTGCCGSFWSGHEAIGKGSIAFASTTNIASVSSGVRGMLTRWRSPTITEETAKHGTAEA
jgi:uncharacterized membrane protein